MAVASYEEVVGVLRQYANALRGDWGDIDGRAEKIVLDELADELIIAHQCGHATIPLRQLRYGMGLCTEGTGRWMDSMCGPCCDDHPHEKDEALSYDDFVQYLRG